MLIFSVRNGHFGLLNERLEVLILETGFRHLLALNSHNSGLNAHLAVSPTPRRHLPAGGA
jgi:hypothetical protein